MDPFLSKSGASVAKQEAAQELAISALAFIASDPELLPRFLNLTGIEASQIRLAAQESGFLAGVLRFILAHEPTLLAFCEATNIAPAQVSSAARALPFGDDQFEAST